MYNLDDIQFIMNDKYSDDEIKKYLLMKQDLDLNVINKELKKTLKIFLNRIYNCDNKKKNEWIMCKNECEDSLKVYFKKEIYSTIYILKCLVNSIITVNKKNTIKLKIKINTDNLENLKGLWDNDNKYLKIIDICGINNDNDSPSRLIMGFGPSASGKTYWAENIINLFYSLDNNFPQSFISVDGGIYRQSSEIYKLSVETAEKVCSAGFLNLVLSSISIINKSLFDAGIIKKMIYKYLLIESKTIKISLYVPETLGDCGEGLSDLRIKNCEKKYEPYLKITDDYYNWIGLLIWQHKHAINCDLPHNFKCVGCTESGQSREIVEGKKYSNSAWEHSIKLGKNEVLKAPGGSYMIHNSGGKKYKNKYNKSLLQDFSKNTITDELIDIFSLNQNKYNYLYSISYNIKV